MRIAYSTVGRQVRSGEQLTSFDGNIRDVAGQRVKLVLRGVEKTAASLVLRIALATDPQAPIVAGNLYTYGEGPVVGSNIQDRFAPMTLALDITTALRGLPKPSHVNVFLHILDPHGRERTDEAITLESAEIDVSGSE